MTTLRACSEEAGNAYGFGAIKAAISNQGCPRSPLRSLCALADDGFDRFPISAPQPAFSDLLLHKLREQ
jgi:hypothetical protein